jgi:hypothetical protein
MVMQTILLWLARYLAARLKTAALAALRDDIAEPPPKPPPDAELLAVRQAYADVGLDTARFALDLDLVPTGKVYEILHHAARTLGRDLPMRTPRDLIAILERLEQ